MGLFTTGLVCLLFLSAMAVASPAPELVEFFSFEQDFEGWTPNGTDLELGAGGTIPWSITRSEDMAKDGAWSVRLFLVNNNDAGKIWTEAILLAAQSGLPGAGQLFYGPSRRPRFQHHNRGGGHSSAGYAG